MQEALPALVLNSEALPRQSMDERTSGETNPANPSATSGISDEQLMLAFSKGSTSLVLRTRTGKVKDVLEVEEEIAPVRGEIEQMEAEQQTLEHRVTFATIDLKLAEEYKAQLSSPAPSVATQLRNATVNGFRSASESLLGIILFFAESGPTLVLWLAILFFPGWMLWRRYRRIHALGTSI